jgi:peptidyl-prolyl cis-trans isomerase C
MQKKLKIGLFTMAAALFVLGTGLSTLAGAATYTNTGSTASGKGTVARVNGTDITREQFDNAMSYQLEIAAMSGVNITDQQMAELKYQVLESLIDNELLYQESQRSGIKIEEQEINDAYEANKQKAQFKTDAEFEAALKQTNKSIASYRVEIEHGLAIDRFILNTFSNNLVVSDSDAKNYYDANPGYFQQPAQVRVSHIMIRVDSDADQTAQDAATEKIEQVKKRIQAGEDFAAVAGEVSEDTNSKGNGGDLGYLSKGQVTQSFEDAAFALNKGETSDIVRTEAGYHIINVTDKSEAKTISFEEAKSDIASTLKNSRVNSLVSSYIKVLKNRSTISTYPVSD